MKYSLRQLSTITLILLMFGVAFGFHSKNRDTIRFYFSGHQDDWQLFMADQVVKDFESSKATVFIYTTAGDAGLDEKYWKARESGAQASEIFVANITNDKGQTWSCGTETIHDHPIRRCTYGKTITYFMRLPDGNCCNKEVRGTGFPKYGNQSLQHLKEQTCKKSPCVVSAVDNSTTYKTWEDFSLTIQELIEFESQRAKASRIWLNAQDYDSKLNPGDHSDHYHTGIAVEQAGDNLRKSTKFRIPLHNVWFVDYDTFNREPNLNSSQFMAKTGAFIEYDRTVWEIMQGQSTLCESYGPYSKWLYRTYSRIE